MPTLNNWSVTPLDTFDPYQAPETVRKGLHGNVIDHPRFCDGEEITTSEIVRLEHDLDSDEVVITTRSGTAYTLGTVSEDYSKHYPNARQRLIDAAKKRPA
jgi:hypothetical protein